LLELSLIVSYACGCLIVLLAFGRAVIYFVLFLNVALYERNIQGQILGKYQSDHRRLVHASQYLKRTRKCKEFHTS